MSMQHKCLCKRDVPDKRDRQHRVAEVLVRGLPESVDLTQECASVDDQLCWGSCTANAIAAADHFVMMRSNPGTAFKPSRMFIYDNERIMEGTPLTEDAGAQIRTGIKSLVKYGVLPETSFPYVDFNFSHPPSPSNYIEAEKHQILEYKQLDQVVEQLKGCLAERFPFVCGIMLYTSFETDAVAQTGTVPLPADDEACLGGHAVMFVGYDDKTRRFKVRNSWGEGWGMKGYFTLPYEYMENEANLAHDFWTIRKSEDFAPVQPVPTPTLWQRICGWFSGAVAGSTERNKGFAEWIVLACVFVVSVCATAITSRMHNRSNDTYVQVYASSNVVVIVTQTAEPTGGGTLTVPVSPTK